ncbi:uncharacterized protein J4E79_008717 [Alternaria viburni]|uniref:uncharacterized protein n=1 Tax=Alternaria viburni TaxID=566460 RepID=UPI0020C4EAB5|nr:uncharacterized protein J4E79_008717 [Alternaria viburni]KAI4653203.1 hypothetical protein J4E79_008717 [Alternaria viburni]
MGERPESRNVWQVLLKAKETELSDQKKRVLQFYESWEGLGPLKFMQKTRISGADTRELDFFKEAFDDTTAYLEKTLGMLHSKLYFQAVRCHISVNVHSYEKALQNIATPPATGRRNIPAGMDPIFTERACVYADNVPKFVEEMEESQRGWNHGDVPIPYEDVWWTMMMRLNAWTMSVRWMDREGVKIPCEHYHNPTRVYIL